MFQVLIIFNSYSINKIQTFVSIFWWIPNHLSLWIQGPTWIRGYFSKANNLVSMLLKSALITYALFRIPQHQVVLEP